MYTLSVPLLFIFYHRGIRKRILLKKKKKKCPISLYILFVSCMTQNMQTDLYFITKSEGGCTVYKELSLHVFSTGRTLFGDFNDNKTITKNQEFSLHIQ